MASARRYEEPPTGGMTRGEHGSAAEADGTMTVRPGEAGKAGNRKIAGGATAPTKPKKGARGRTAAPAPEAPRTSTAVKGPGVVKRRRGRAEPAGAMGSASRSADPAVDRSAEQLPVREGEERWTEPELAQVRARLEEEITAMRTGIAAAETQIAQGDTSGGAGDDQADAGAKTYEREQELALAYNSRDLLAQNERAVARMDAGTYGICESCGLAIGKARLQAFPRATLCVKCKQRQERR